MNFKWSNSATLLLFTMLVRVPLEAGKIYNFPYAGETWCSVLSEATSRCYLAVRTFSFLFSKIRKLSYFGVSVPKSEFGCKFIY